jgi:glycosyltransferase involved in cell wall biosynthesis
MSERLPVLLDASHTSHTRAQTGIQRVCRSLFAEMEQAGGVAAICFDPHLDDWRNLQPDELAVLRDRSGGRAGGTRGARWTLPQKISGHARRLAGRRTSLPPARGLVCPELFPARIGARLDPLVAHVAGPCVAVFHDAIGLKYPELTPPGTVARLPAYLRELLQFDGVAAVSDDSAASLRDYWHWLGIANPPPVQTIANGVDEVPAATGPAVTTRRVLCVGTIEGRKNHAALLEAAETVWREGVPFELELIGMARADTAAPALERIAALQKAGRPLHYRGSVSEDRLHLAYAQCAFTVYPSLMEGFGLPVLESLRHGKPCVCSDRGSLGESARGGGCVALPAVDPASLAWALRRLLQDPAELARLAAAARTRTFRTWRDYAGDLAAWMATLRRRR